MQQTDLCGQARLTAYSAPSADAWLRATPSHNQDTLLSNAAFRDVLSMRLGVKIFDDGMARSFCQQNLDRHGHHCMGCMGQGHKTTNAHVFSQCRPPSCRTRWRETPPRTRELAARCSANPACRRFDYQSSRCAAVILASLPQACFRLRYHFPFPAQHHAPCCCCARCCRGSVR